MLPASFVPAIIVMPIFILAAPVQSHAFSIITFEPQSPLRDTKLLLRSLPQGQRHIAVPLPLG